MTIPATARKAGPFLGNSSTTTFPFTFRVFEESDILVQRMNVDMVLDSLVLDVDYSVTLNPDQDTSPGGTVTYPVSGAPLPVGAALVVVGNLPYDQPLDIPDGGNFRPEAIENELDRMEMQIQQLRELLTRTLALPATSTSSPILPAPSANALIGWNDSANALQNFDPTALATVVAYGTARGDIFDGNGIKTVFVLSSNPGSLYNLDVSIAGVTQLPGVDYFWTGNTLLTFSSPPPNGVKILVRYMQGLPSINNDAQSVLYSVPGAPRTTDVATYLTGGMVNALGGNWGITGDGVTDDTAAIQACIDANVGRTIYFPAATYKVSTLLCPEQTHILGDSPDLAGDGMGPFTRFLGTPGADIFTFDNSVPFPAGFWFENIDVKGGRNGWYVGPTQVITHVYLRNTTGSSMSNAVFCQAGIFERFVFDTFFWGSGCKYAWQITNPGFFNYIALGTVSNGRIVSDTTDPNSNGINFDFRDAGQSVSFYNVFIVATGGTGMVLNCPAEGWIFEHLNFEGTGIALESIRVNTTCNTTSGSPNVTVPVTTIANGTVVTIEAAGVGLFGITGADLTATVLSGGGTNNLVLDTNASASLTGTRLTTSRADNVSIGVSSGTGYAPTNVVFRNSNISTARSGSGSCRYGINNPRGANIVVENSTLGYAYDPFGSIRLRGTITGGPVLVASGFRTFNGWPGVESSGAPAGGALYVKPAQTCGLPGVGVEHQLIGSTGGGRTGSFGSELWKKTTTSAGIDLLRVNADTEALEVLQKIAYTTGSASLAGGGALTLPDNTSFYQNTNGSTIASFTLTAPAAPVQGQLVSFATNGAITTFTFAANAGQSLGLGFPATLAAGASFTAQYLGTTWYKK